jgi:uncharacterized protein (DUF362 family)
MQTSMLFRRGAGRGATAAFGLTLLAALAALTLAAVSLAAEETAARWKATDPPNQPIGEAKGIFPGRVVWTHNPDAAQWDGNTETGGWYEDRFTDPKRAAAMLSETLQLLTGAKTDAEAWDALFRHYNRAHGRGDVGYKPGEKLAIKVNMNCSKRRPDFKEGSYNTPQLTMALLRQLVKTAGVPETDIVVYDASRWVGDAIFLPARAEFPGIRIGDREGTEGRFEVQPDKSVALHFADPSVADSGTTYLPACVTGATYLINAAVLKGHSLAAVTLPAKNHFGSVYRDSEQARKTHNGWNPGNMHDAIMVRTRPMGSYNPLVELMGHKDLGGKTILYLIDGLYAAPHQGKLPERWESSPFNGHWTASVFASQDPVAIESVAVDLCGAEKTQVQMVGTVDNYLHEAALANEPPSHARYDPEGDGTPLGSLGVHEHWNNAEKKQYSRDLGTGKGIELIRAGAK